jgi:hypothetical protein
MVSEQVYLFLFENPKILVFLCSLSQIPAPLGLGGTYLDHQASPVDISDRIGSLGFAGDHLGLISVHQASPVTISDFYQLTRLRR